MPSPPATIFNTNPLPIQVSVNGGGSFSITGATAPNWLPASSPAGRLSWNYNGPGPDTFGPGANSLTITPAGGAAPMQLLVALSAQMQWHSIQIHTYFSRGGVGWVAMNDGQFVDGALSQLP